MENFMSYDSLISLDTEYIILNEHELSHNQKYFLDSCKSGNIDTIQWILYFDTSIDFSMYNYLPFILTCEYNQLDLAKYIYNRDSNLNIDKHFFNTVLMFCEEGYLDFLKWFYIIFENNFKQLSHLEYYRLFKNACMTLNYNIALCLYDNNSNIPINLHKDEIFLDACKSNNIELASILYSMRPKGYILYIEDDNIIHYEIITTLLIENCIHAHEFENIDECKICYEKSNIYTSCKHFFCYNCLEQHYEKNNFKCPYCRTTNYEDNLYNIISLL